MDALGLERETATIMFQKYALKTPKQAVKYLDEMIARNRG